jgi:uncharacterized protein involved in type VI secretion and phage assembly
MAAPDLLGDVVERVQGRYYGKYRGFVTDNQDPDQRGRLRLRIPSVLGDAQTAWALPVLPFGGTTDVGLFLIPETGAQVWAEFEEGDVSRPLWVGAFWPDPPPGAAQPAGTPVLGDPVKRSLRTPGGHVLTFDDTSGSETLTVSHPAGAGIAIDENGTASVTAADGGTVVLDADAGTVTVEDANGNALEMSSSGTTVEDANGNRIEMAPSGVTVKGQSVTVDATQVTLGGSGGEPVIKGQSFLTAYMTHTHPTGMGPSGPPIPAGESSALSAKVMTS